MKGWRVFYQEDVYYFTELELKDFSVGGFEPVLYKYFPGALLIPALRVPGRTVRAQQQMITFIYCYGSK